MLLVKLMPDLGELEAARGRVVGEVVVGRREDEALARERVHLDRREVALGADVDGPRRGGGRDQRATGTPRTTAETA